MTAEKTVTQAVRERIEVHAAVERPEGRGAFVGLDPVVPMA